MTVAVKPLPLFGVVRQANHAFPRGSLVIRLPLLLWWFRRRYDINCDEFTRGWRVLILQVRVGKPHHGWGCHFAVVAAFTTFGKQTLCRQT